MIRKSSTVLRLWKRGSEQGIRTPVKGQTGILLVDIPVPWNCGVDERAGSIRVLEDREIDRDLGASPSSDVGRQGPTRQ